MAVLGLARRAWVRVQRLGIEAGMTTAEYTVGTLGACSFAAVLIKIAQTEWFGELVKGLLGNITGIAGF